MRVDGDYLIRTLAELVRINSINPAFSDGATNEMAIAAHTGESLQKLGLDVVYYDAEPGRRSVVGTLRGRGGGRSLMLYAHMDTVGVEGMAEPFSGAVQDGRLYGRGAYDMKGSLATCMTAVKALADSGTQLAGDVLVAGVADEEVASIGMSEVLRHHRPDGAIVTEPTELELCIAHKGFCWIEVETIGRAAHGSRFQDGIDANMRMGRFLVELEKLERALRESSPHPLVGPPSLHAAVLHGGTGTSTYAARSRLEIERRTIPGESEEQVLGEIGDIIDRLTAADSTFQAQARAYLTRDPFEAAPDSLLVRMIRRRATEVLGNEPRTIGVAYWMDAALLGAAGVDTVVIGPIGAGAHAAEEWVDLESAVKCAEILARTVIDYSGAAG